MGLNRLKRIIVDKKLVRDLPNGDYTLTIKETERFRETIYVKASFIYDHETEKSKAVFLVKPLWEHNINVYDKASKSKIEYTKENQPKITSEKLIEQFK